MKKNQFTAELHRSKFSVTKGLKKGDILKMEATSGFIF